PRDFRDVRLDRSQLATSLGRRKAGADDAIRKLELRAPWSEDSSFPSQLVFRFEYEPLVSSPACRLAAHAFCSPVRGWPIVTKPDLLLKPVAISAAEVLDLDHAAVATRRAQDLRE